MQPGGIVLMLNTLSVITNNLQSKFAEVHKTLGNEVPLRPLVIPADDDILNIRSYGDPNDDVNKTNPFFPELQGTITAFNKSSATDQAGFNLADIRMTANKWAVYNLFSVKKKLTVSDKSAVIQSATPIQGWGIPSDVMTAFMNDDRIKEKYAASFAEDNANMNILKQRSALFTPMIFIWMMMYSVSKIDFRKSLKYCFKTISDVFHYGLLESNTPMINGFLQSCGVCADVSAAVGGAKLMALKTKSCYCILKLLLATVPELSEGFNCVSPKLLNLIVFLVAYYAVNSESLKVTFRKIAKVVIANINTDAQIGMASGLDLDLVLKDRYNGVSSITHIMSTLFEEVCVDEEKVSINLSPDQTRILTFVFQLAVSASSFAQNKKAVPPLGISKHVIALLVKHGLFQISADAVSVGGDDPIFDQRINDVAKTVGNVYYPVETSSISKEFAKDAVTDVPVKFVIAHQDCVTPQLMTAFEMIRRNGKAAQQIKDMYSDKPEAGRRIDNGPVLKKFKAISDGPV